MRLHRLALGAFGPFPGRVEVDLDAVSGSGIFLIHGPTGAGKTTLLDAICFALYAGVPGARPAGRSLRSDHAGPDAVPTVELELTVGDRRLLLTRSPEWTRPKRRGTGTTTVPAAVTLRERAGAGWTAVSTRADEVGALVRDLLGLGLDQFATVVLLPQGGFAAFLRASPESRRELLERLFDVSRFTDVEDELAARRRQVTAELAAAQGCLATALARTSDVLARLPEAPAAPLPLWDEVPVEKTAAVVSDLARAAQAQATRSLVDRDAAEAHERSLRAACDAAARQRACRDRGVRARAVLAALAERGAFLRAAADALAAGRRAAALAGDLRARADAVARADAARSRAAHAGAALTRLALGPVTSLEQARALAAGVADLDGCLAEAEHLSAALREARDRLGEQDRLAGAARAGHAAALAAANRLGDTVAVLAERHASAAAHAPDPGVLDRDEQDLATRLRARRALEEHRTRLRRARQRHREALAAHADARDRWLDRRSAQLDGMAARLAAGLTDGSPCPVCGSPRHPRPADLAALVPDAAVASADAAVATAQEQLTGVAAQVAGDAATVAALREQLRGEDRDAPTLAALLRDATARRKAGEASRRRLAALREQLEAAASELADARARCEDAARAERAAASRLEAMQGQVTREQDALRERLRRHGERCPCAVSSVDALPAARARHRDVAGALGDLGRALEAVGEADEHEARTSADVARRLTDHGFGSVADAQAAAVPPDALTASERVLAEAERDRVQAQTVLSDPDVVAALGGTLPDLAAVAQSVSQATAARQGADRRHAVTELCARELAGLAGEVTRAARSVTDRGRVQAVTARLADTVGGLGADNTLRMRLSSFVLAARLERVVDLANERLARLGDGRYRLRHSDARARGTGRSGLGLQVEDLWTGQARDTTTLSGGETFLASLALALGLADAVREEAGGFDLQTLFVDEGFGALDEDSLEQVLGVLDQLRDGGRAVGVVSHVADLRSRIPEQLWVDKGPAGSTVRAVGAQAPSP